MDTHSQPDCDDLTKRWYVPARVARLPVSGLLVPLSIPLGERTGPPNLRACAKFFWKSPVRRSLLHDGADL
jgi:hypothetical protein